MIHYSVITPSILRPTLITLCKTIDTQSCQDYEHIIMVDIPKAELNDSQHGILSQLYTKQREVYFCDKRHCNTGNTCRHNATKLAKGDYVYYIDDDDFLADCEVLETLKQVTADWAIFPVNLCGQSFFYDPPGMCHATTGGFLLRRGLIEWPDVPNYETDGIIVEELLRRQVPYQVVKGRDLAVHPKWNIGKAV